MTNSTPYLYKNEEWKYAFISDTGTQYTIEFTNAQIQLINLPKHILVFDLEIDSPSNQVAYDARVSATVIAILIDFFQDRSNCIVYTCDNLDGRHRARARKFSTWFSKANDGQFQKVDLDFVIEDIEIVSSLIIHVSNPFKQEIIDVFLNQPDFYRDKLE